jgi:hypothetical protein
VNGVHKDPQTVQLPAAEPLRTDALRRFQGQAAPLLGKLEPPAAGTLLAASRELPRIQSRPELAVN